MWECKKGVIKASLNAKCYSLSSLFLTEIAVIYHIPSHTIIKRKLWWILLWVLWNANINRLSLYFTIFNCIDISDLEYLMVPVSSYGKNLFHYIPIWVIDKSLTGTNSLDQSGLGSNNNERVLPRSPELEPHHQMQFEKVFYHVILVSVSSDVYLFRVNGSNWKYLKSTKEKCLTRM